MKKMPVLFCLGLLGITSLQSQEPSENQLPIEVLRKLAQSADFQKAKVYDEALKGYKELLLQPLPDKVRAVIFSNRAVLRTDQKQWDMAIADCNESLKLMPANVSCWNTRAKAYREKGDYPQAIKDHAESINLNPEKAESYLYRADTYKAMRDQVSAVENYEKVLMLSPENAEAMTALAVIYREKNLPTLSLTWTQKAITANPDYADAYNEHGVTLNQQGKLTEAVGFYGEAAKRVPNNETYQRNFGIGLLATKKAKESTTPFSKILELNKSDLKTRKMRAMAYISSGSFPEALKDIHIILAKTPDDIEVLTCRALIYTQNNNLDAAMKDYQKAIDLTIKDGEVGPLIQRAMVWMGHEKWKPALDDLNLAVNTNDSHLEARNLLTVLLSAAPDETIRDKSRALSLAVETAKKTEYKEYRSLDALAIAHAENGNFEEAEKYIQNALDLAGRNAPQLSKMKRRQQLFLQKQPYRLELKGKLNAELELTTKEN